MWSDNGVLALFRDGFMQGSSPGVAAAYSDVRGKYILFKAVAKQL